MILQVFQSQAKNVKDDVLVRLAVLESKIDRLSKCTRCPNGWVTFNDLCYLFGPNKLSLNKAKLFCKERDSYMLVVETKEENDFLKEFMKSIEGVQNKSSYWLGLSENPLTGKWIWQQWGTEGTFVDWGPSEPNNPKVELCAWSEQIKDYMWSDVRCNRETTPVCKKRVTIKE